jgi:hypothetical protein
MAAKRLIRPTNCGVLLLLPDAAKTPYPAYELRVRLLLPYGGETPYPAYVLRVRLLLPDGGVNALSGLMAQLL